MPELSNYRRELFSRYMVACKGNRSKAALKAGFAKSSARQYGSYLMSNHDIRKRIDELKAASFDAAEITVDLLLKAFYQEYATATHPRDRIAALERLARMRGAFTDNVNQGGAGDIKAILSTLRGHLPEETLTALASRFNVTLEDPEPTHDGSAAVN
jgi:hypothetical protein